MATWVIQNNGVNLAAAYAVRSAVRDIGGKVCSASVYPSTGTIDYKNEAPKGKNTIPYGSTVLVELARKEGWDGLFVNDNFNSTVWNEQRKDMLNQDSEVIKISDLKDYVVDRRPGEMVFIRPHLDRKLFTGTKISIFDLSGVEQDLSIGHTHVTHETEITVASVKEIASETRWFVVGGKVIDGSTYRVRGQQQMYHIGNENDIAEAQKLADVWLPHETCVMDVAETPYGLKVIEFNCFNSSGFYHHDIPKIIKAVNALF